MTIKELRNIFVLELYNGLGRGPKVLLSEQVQPELEYPFIIYQAVQPYMGGPHNIRHERTGETTAIAYRDEQAEGTYSFTACSMNRVVDGLPISGEDEALSLAEQAQSWFLFAGKQALSIRGIVVLEIMNVQPRSALGVDEMDRRYGFDVRMRYGRTDTAPAIPMKEPIIFNKED